MASYTVKLYEFQQCQQATCTFSLVNLAGGFRPTESIRFWAMLSCSCVKTTDGLVVEGRSGMTIKPSNAIGMLMTPSRINSPGKISLKHEQKTSD